MVQGPFKVSHWWCHKSSPPALGVHLRWTLCCDVYFEHTVCLMLIYLLNKSQTVHSCTTSFLDFSLSVHCCFLSSVKLSTRRCTKLSFPGVPAVPASAQSVKVKDISPEPGSDVIQNISLPPLLLLSSSPCLLKIGQLWAIWPQVKGLHRNTPTHGGRCAALCSFSKKEACSGPENCFCSRVIEKHAPQDLSSLKSKNTDKTVTGALRQTVVYLQLSN